MKRFLLICVITAALYACDKETTVTYDTHLFQQLQAHRWVLDSARITDSLGRDSIVDLSDTTVEEITQFNSQQYLINRVRKRDTAMLDTTLNQIIYDNPKRMYYYDDITQQILTNQYLDIDTVNADMLFLIKTDTLKSITYSHYHAK